MNAPSPQIPLWPRRIFFAAWSVAAVVIVVLLVAFAGHPISGGTTNQASYVGSKVPTWTNFTFLISESIALYQLNLTGTSPTDNVTILIFGNWSASSSTSVETTVGGVSPACPFPWGCYGAAGSYSGTINTALTIPTDPSSHLGVPELTVDLVFWALSTDTVTATSPIYATTAL